MSLLPKAGTLNKRLSSTEKMSGMDEGCWTRS